MSSWPLHVRAVGRVDRHACRWRCAVLLLHWKVPFLVARASRMTSVVLAVLSGRRLRCGTHLPAGPSRVMHDRSLLDRAGADAQLLHHLFHLRALRRRHLRQRSAGILMPDICWSSSFPTVPSSPAAQSAASTGSEAASSSRQAVRSVRGAMMRSPGYKDPEDSPAAMRAATRAIRGRGLRCARGSRPGNRCGTSQDAPGRKVRAPVDKVPGNAWGARAHGKCNRK